MLNVARYQDPDRDGVIAFVDEEDIDFAIAKDLQDGYLRYPLWISWDGDQVVGLLEGDLKSWLDAAYWPANGYQAWICNMTVHRNRRREGIGKTLVRAFAHACAGVGVHYVGLELNPLGDVEGRRAFFEACGFETNPVDGNTEFMGAPVSELLARLVEAGG